MNLKYTLMVLMILEFQQIIAQGTWTQKPNGFTTTRAGVVGFSIGNKGYLGTGWDWINSILYNDYWEWDPATSAWTQKASIPDSAPIYPQPTYPFNPISNAVANALIDPGNIAFCDHVFVA